MLTSYDGKAIITDEIGNMLTDGTWTYTWEHGRELVSMTDGSTTWSYEYNADGLRTKRTNGTNTYYYCYADGQLLTMRRNYSFFRFAYDASGAPMTVIYGGETYFYVTNIQGDVIAILDDTGATVVEYTYDAWGNVLTTTGSMASTLGIINPLRYRGYVYDTETGLYYLQSRYYDPEIGRFINADSYASTGQGILGNNMFAYCLNNPVNNIDATGDVAVSTAVIIGAGIAGGLLGLCSYLCSTPEPTIKGSLIAIITGAGSAIIGAFAGPVDDVAKLLWSAVSGVISAISSGYTTWECGGSLGDISTSIIAAFAAGTVTTYLGSFLDTSMFAGFDEGASTYCMTVFTGSFSMPLSCGFDAGMDTAIDAVVRALTYVPKYTPTRFRPGRSLGGPHGDPIYARSIS